MEPKRNLAVPETAGSELVARRKDESEVSGGANKTVNLSYRLDSPQIERYVTFTPKAPYGLSAVINEKKLTDKIKGKFLQRKIYGPVRLSSSIRGAIFLKMRPGDDIETAVSPVLKKYPGFPILIQQEGNFYLVGKDNGKLPWKVNSITKSKDISLPNINEGEYRRLNKHKDPKVIRFIRESNLHFEEKISAYAERGVDLFDFLCAKSNFTTEQLFFVLLGIAYGIKELHDKGMVHRDLKLQNIIVFPDSKTGYLIPKISDLDSCVEEGKGTDKVYTSDGYASPEVLLLADSLKSNHLHDDSFLGKYPGARKKNDVWAFAKIMDYMSARFKERVDLSPQEMKAIHLLQNLIKLIIDTPIHSYRKDDNSTRLDIDQTITELNAIVHMLPYRRKIHNKLREIADDNPDRISQYQKKLEEYKKIVEEEKNTLRHSFLFESYGKPVKLTAIQNYIKNLDVLRQTDHSKFKPFTAAEWAALTRATGSDRLFKKYIAADIDLFYKIEELQLKATAPAARPTAAH